jgi:hypothetical protein
MRHGARYPTAGDAAELFAARLEALGDTFQASGELSFMNEWKYRLGSDILVPFGRQQCYQLGVRSRMAYGRLLGDFYDKGALPVVSRVELSGRAKASRAGEGIGVELLRTPGLLAWSCSSLRPTLPSDASI